MHIALNKMENNSFNLERFKNWIKRWNEIQMKVAEVNFSITAIKETTLDILIT